MSDIPSPQDVSSGTDPVPAYTPHAMVSQMLMTAWAKVEKGVVREIKVVQNHLPHPFPDHESEGGRVVNVTAVPCAVGYVVDTHGNVAPPPEVRADATVIAPTMPAPGAQASAVQAGPVEDKAISMDEQNARRKEMVEAAGNDEKPADEKPAETPAEMVQPAAERSSFE